MNKKVTFSLALIAATGAVLLASACLRASEMGGVLEDSSITTRVRESLRNHPRTSDLAATVETTRGVVTVAGIANNTPEKALVTKIIADVEGVNGVINNLTIETPDVSDGKTKSNN
jgi:osmotically-inducible protein OsmY